jgi:hypothetical protein
MQACYATNASTLPRAMIRPYNRDLEHPRRGLPAQILAKGPTGVNGKGVPLHTSRKLLSHIIPVHEGTLFPVSPFVV